MSEGGPLDEYEVALTTTDASRSLHLFHALLRVFVLYRGSS